MRLAFVLALALAACGGNNPGDDDGGAVDAPNIDCSSPPDLSNMLYPWKVGTTWTWLLSDPNSSTTMVNDTTVESYEAVPGRADKCAFKVTGEKLFGNTLSWDDYEGDIGVRYFQSDFDQGGGHVDDQAEDPYRLKADETPAHLTQGATYSETFDETTTDSTGTTTRAKQEDWEVVSMSESVTVPAGTYDTVHLRRTNHADPTKIKDFWFARGVGKVKETGGEQDQDLMAYTP
jgi:hypothetical protein